MVIDEARRRIDGPRPRAGGRDDARRDLSRSRQAGDDGADRRTHSIARPRRRRRRAGDGAARSPQRAHARRLRRAPRRARPGRASPEAEHVQEVADAGQRRRVSAAGAEGRPRTAGALRQGRLPRPHGTRSTARRWTGSSSARARSASSTRRPPPLVLGRHLLELGVAPGPAMGTLLKAIYERQLDGEVTTLDAGPGAGPAADQRPCLECISNCNY